VYVKVVMRTSDVNRMISSLEKEMIEKAGIEMSREIDREVLWSMLKEIGWTRVILSSETAMINATAIKEWLSFNCLGSYEKHYSDFIFENTKDASMFILRWS
jgi:hypothetical protein